MTNLRAVRRALSSEERRVLMEVALLLREGVEKDPGGEALVLIRKNGGKYQVFRLAKTLPD